MTAGEDSRHQTSPVTKKQFESLVCAATDAILGVDHQGNITIWNAAATKLFGYKAKEVIGTSLHDLLVPRHMLAKANKGYEGFVETGQGPLVGKATECIALRKDGSEFPVELSISSFKQDDHWHATGIVRDITERKQAEDQLNDAKSNLELNMNLLRSVVEEVPIRIFWKDRDSRFLGCNSLFAIDAGLSSPEEVIGKTDFEMGWKDQADLYRSDDRLIMETGVPKLGYEEPQSTPEGEMIWLRTSKVPLCNEAQEVIGILGVYEDITERKRAVEELRKKLDEIERMNRLMVGRELKMEELRKEIRRLKNAASS
jgi:PAS domain S-box-containing protein